MIKLDLLRAVMKREKVDAYLIPSGDFHGSEYVCETFRAREYLSGFTGSAGTLLVTGKEAGLWTDGRYFIQAERELAGSGITLFRMQETGVPTVMEYLKDKMQPGEVLAFDGRCISAESGRRYEKELKEKKVSISYDKDLVEEIWEDRPALPCHSVWSVSSAWSGESCQEKIERVRKALGREGAESLLLTKLDDVMWLFNIRGSDIPCNPVALSYGYIGEKTAVLFVQKGAVTETCQEALREGGVSVFDYENLFDWIRGLEKERILLDESQCNYALYQLISKRNSPVLSRNPVEQYKAVKNSVELEHIRNICRLDSAAVIRFIRWIKQKVKSERVTEAEAAEYLDGLRKENAGFLECSFPTICAYGANGAMMHYEAKEGGSVIEAKGLLLVDSGGQYMGGTTDVTRTIVLGEISREMKKQYTAVVKGMFALSRAVFLAGCTGRNLDILAREPLWQMGLDYKCGTGHGIGYMLNVHEGPQNIRWSYRKDSEEAVLEPGMLVSDEPGVYREGSHGIRIENMLAVKEVMENGDGRFLGFDTLTPVPIDREGIEAAEMTGLEIRQWNAYHRWVYETMKDFLNDEEQEWLKDATRPID